MEFKDEVWMTFFKTTNPVIVAEEEKENIMIRFFNYDYLSSRSHIKGTMNHFGRHF